MFKDKEINIAGVGAILKVHTLGAVFLVTLPSLFYLRACTVSILTA